MKKLFLNQYGRKNARKELKSILPPVAKMGTDLFSTKQSAKTAEQGNGTVGFRIRYITNFTVYLGITIGLTLTEKAGAFFGFCNFGVC